MNTLSHVSHEIRTPLNCIIGMLKTAEDDKQYFFEQQLKPTLTAAQLLANLTNDLLDQTQWNAGTFKLVIESFNIINLINNIIEEMKILTEAKGLELLVQYDDFINLNPFINSDQYRIRQILINLIGNSTKFTTKGYIKILVQLQNSNNLLIKVRDTGLGISQENQQKLFKAFGKIENNQLNPQGVGLGLLISNKLAFQLSQTLQSGLTVESVLNQGTTFQFYVQNKQNMEEPKNSFRSISNSSRQYNKPILFKQTSLDSKSFKKKNENGNRLNNLTKSYTNQRSFNKQKSQNQSLNKIAEDLEYNMQEYNLKSFRGELSDSSYSTQQIQDLKYAKIDKIFQFNLHNNTENNQSLKHESITYNNPENVTQYTQNEFSARGLPSFIRNNLQEDEFKVFQLQNLAIRQKNDYKENIECHCNQILIVDDFPFNIKALQNIIKQKFKLECDTSISGQDAIEKVQQRIQNQCCQTYKLIFMDIEMPQMNGIETTHKIKEILEKNKPVLESRTTSDSQQCIETNIIGLTGITYNKNIDEKINESGMQNILTKPIQINLLENCLNQYKLINK